MSRKSRPAKTHRGKRLSLKERQRRTLINTHYVIEWFKQHPCLDCGEQDILVLTFDHVRGVKRFNIGGCLGAITLKELKLEILKTESRCVSCHARKNARERRTLKWRLLHGED